MARTLIGSLIIRLKQEGAAETKRSVTDALRGIESATQRLNTSRWGNQFDEALRRLKVSPIEHTAIVASWDKLNQAVGGRLTGPQKSGWRNGVLAHLATVRTDIDRTNERAKVLNTTLGSLLKFGATSFGVYGGYTVARGGVNAAFEQQRVEAAGYFSGLSTGDQGALKAAAEELSAKYGLFVGNMLTVLQEAAMSMPSTEAALGSGDAMARLLTSLEAVYGPEGAVAQLYSFNKAADNAEFNLTPEEYYTAADNFIKAQRVLGKDFSAEAFKQAIQYARIAGKALDDHFLQTWLPVLASETSGADAGTQTRALFDQLVGGRAPEAAKNQMQEWGVLDENENIAQSDVYGQNPTIWAHDVLLPLLEKAGVDTENEIALANALTHMTNNRLASDNLARSIMQFEQYLRTAETLIPQAKGLEAAEEVRQRDPFAAVQGMVNSLSNLSGAMGEHLIPIIIPAMTAFSSAVETVAGKIRSAEGWEVGLASLGVVLGGIGAIGVGKVGLAWMTAGPSLQTAAIMLQGAAQSLGGAGAAGVAGGGKNGGGWLSGLTGWAAALGIAGAPGFLSELVTGGPNSTEEFNSQVDEQGKIKAQLWDMINGAGNWFNPGGAVTAAPLDTTGDVPGLSDMLAPEALDNMGVPRHPFGYSPADQSASLDQLNAKAGTAGAALGDLNTTLSPKVDTSSIDLAIQKVARLAAALQAIGPLAQARSGNATSTMGDYASFNDGVFQP